MLREEEDADREINWLNKISREKWTLAWDGSWQWGHMITNLDESINSVLKKSRNLPISALVKSTYVRCNALLNKRGREVATMLASSQLYMEVLNKVIKDALRKTNAHTILEFYQCDTRFLVQETINLREVRLTGDFTIKLEERWCDCGKFQKLHMLCSHVVATCKHAHHEYINYIHPVCTLESVSNVCRWLFGELHNEAYWSPCHEPMISLDPEKKRSTKGYLVSSCIHTEMDIHDFGQRKWCSVCHPRLFKEKLSSPCRLKPTTLNVCHIVCIFKILLY